MSHLLVVGQAFKGSLSAAAVARALAEGAAATGAPTMVIVGSDGGDGLLDAVAAPRRSTHRVTGPLGEPVDAAVGWIDAHTAVVESRLACGVALLPWDRRDPERTTTRGVGELLKGVAAAGATHAIVGLGGSATMDGGLGAARAWGWHARDEAGADLPDGGGALSRLHALEAGPPLGLAITALADVRNALLGRTGAAVYARQKGATPEATERLMDGLQRLVDCTGPWHGPAVAARPGAGAAGGLGFGLACFAGAAVYARQKGATPEATDRLMAGLQRLVDCTGPWHGPAVAARPGAGAAGGLGFGLACFAGAALEAGAAWILRRAGFEDALREASAVIVAEAAFDATSLAGKLTGEVVRRAQAARVPVAVVTPRPLIRPSGVVVVERRGRWRPADVAAMAERAGKRLLRLPRP